MKILGLSFFYHDSAACLLVDGRPLAMAEEERFSRKKHDSGFPSLAIEFVLKEGGLRAPDLDWVVFYEKPFLKFDRIIKTSLATWPWAPAAFSESVKTLFLDKLWIRQLIASELKIEPAKVLFSGHHLSHAASAFFSSPFAEAAILTIDGVGEWSTTSLALGRDRQITALKEIHFPHSLGLLYSAFTAFLGFEVNEGEYKVMGMAPYGQPKYVDKIKKIIKVFEDGSFELDLDYFSFQRSLKRTYTGKFVELFGAPRDPKSKFFTRQTGWPAYFGPRPQGERFDKTAEIQEYYADIAASIQAVCEELVVGLANHLHKITELDTLCLAGGVALNSVANWKAFEQTPFKKIFVQPAAGDGGGALGAALAVYHSALNHPRIYQMSEAYFGQAYSVSEIREALAARRINYDFFDKEEELIDRVSDYLVEGRVIGWFQGRFEWGPRALGNRSIIADPRRPEMKDIVNTKIKFREPYRPFAPSVLASHAQEFFDIPDTAHLWPAHYMLFVVPVRKEKQETVPAITHVDGSARPQLVFEKDSPRYWRLINSFYKKTGAPLVLNTSFNLRGEPIVNTPDNAINTFIKSEMDVLVMGEFVVLRKDLPAN